MSSWENTSGRRWEREREMGSRRRREVTRVTFFFTLGGLAHVKWRSRPRERPRSALSTSNGGRFQPFNATSASFLPRCANGFRATIAFSSPPSRESRGLVFRRESTTKWVNPLLRLTFHLSRSSRSFAHCSLSTFLLFCELSCSVKRGLAGCDDEPTSGQRIYRFRICFKTFFEINKKLDGFLFFFWNNDTLNTSLIYSLTKL